jgi:hypothetical protein
VLWFVYTLTWCRTSKLVPLFVYYSNIDWVLISYVKSFPICLYPEKSSWNISIIAAYK